MHTTKIRSVGNSSGVVLPKEVTAHMNVMNGDTVTITMQSDGSIVISPYDQEFADQLAAFARGRRKLRNAFKELANR